MALICSTLLMLLYSCEDEPVKRDYPRVRTMEVTNITENGATFTGEIIEEGSEEITEHGFVWAVLRPEINYDSKILLGQFEGTGKFSSDILTNLTEGAIYRVTAFVRSGEYTVYGDEVKFTSLGSSGPLITGFEPAMAAYGDTIKVKGKSFISPVTRTYLDDIATTNIHVTDSVLEIIVPFTIVKRENILSVETVGNRTYYDKELLIVNFPEISSISPSQGYWGDTLSIEVANLRSNMFVRVSVAGIIVTPLEPYDGNNIRIIVPASLVSASSDIIITTLGFPATSPDPFILLPPVIDSISPVEGNWSTIVTLYGRFNPNLTGTSVKFGSIGASIVSVTKDSIKVKVPATLTEPAHLVYMYGSMQCTSVQQFSLSPPEITTVSPMSDYAGGIVTITGNNFNPNNTSVKFNELAGQMISVSTTEARCYVPGGYNGDAVIELTSGSQQAVFAEPFVMTNPYVTSFYPSEGTIGDTITIVCEDYNTATNFIMKTGASGYSLSKVSVIDNRAKAVITKYDATSGYPAASVSRNSVSSVISSEEIFTINSPVISSISPLSVTDGTEVTILGSNFSPVAQYNRVEINGISAPITYSSRNEIRFTVPIVGSTGDFAATVFVGNMSAISSVKLSYSSPWKSLPNLSFTSWLGFAMKFGNDVIIANGPEGRSLYKFEPSSETFSRYIYQTISVPSYHPSVIVKGNKAYMLGNYYGAWTDFKYFDFSSLVVDKESDYPGSVFGDQILLDGDSVLYMGGGYYSSNYCNEFWKYSLSTGIWTRLNDLPGYTCYTNEFKVNNRLYAVFKDRSTYEYDAINDSWIPRAEYPGAWSRYKLNVECDGVIYMGYGDVASETVLRRYDPENDEWVDIEYVKPGLDTSSLFCFSYDGKIYLNCGWGTQSMWMYDPSYTP